MQSKDTLTYRQGKLAHQLITSPQWQELLLPVLASKAQQEPQPLTSLDEAFKTAGRHAEIGYARYLIALVERKAAQFVEASTGRNA